MGEIDGTQIERFVCTASVTFYYPMVSPPSIPRAAASTHYSTVVIERIQYSGPRDNAVQRSQGQYSTVVPGMYTIQRSEVPRHDALAIWYVCSLKALGSLLCWRIVGSQCGCGALVAC
jgi:hypothetical protein